MFFFAACSFAITSYLRHREKRVLCMFYNRQTWVHVKIFEMIFFSFVRFTSEILKTWWWFCHRLRKTEFSSFHFSFFPFIHYTRRRWNFGFSLTLCFHVYPWTISIHIVDSATKENLVHETLFRFHEKIFIKFPFTIFSLRSVNSGKLKYSVEKWQKAKKIIFKKWQT